MPRDLDHNLGAAGLKKAGFATLKHADAAVRLPQFRCGSVRAIGAKDRLVLTIVSWRTR
jgi:hypothetical protein